MERDRYLVITLARERFSTGIGINRRPRRVGLITYLPVIRSVLAHTVVRIRCLPPRYLRRRSASEQAIRAIDRSRAIAPGRYINIYAERETSGRSGSVSRRYSVL